MVVVMYVRIGIVLGHDDPDLVFM